MLESKSIVIALDLEGTLISNAVSQIPRPGLYSFLEYCDQTFKRTVIFTTVREFLFRQIATTLVESKKAPSWFSSIEYISWQGNYKDLSFIPNVVKGDLVFLIDDIEAYIKPEQKSNWIAIPGYEYPYSEDDTELSKMINKLSQLS